MNKLFFVFLFVLIRLTAFAQTRDSIPVTQLKSAPFWLDTNAINKLQPQYKHAAIEMVNSWYNKRKAGNALLLGGAGLAAVGGILLAALPGKNVSAGGYLVFAGALSMASSIPLFVLAKKQKSQLLFALSSPVDQMPAKKHRKKRPGIKLLLPIQ